MKVVSAMLIVVVAVALTVATFFILQSDPTVQIKGWKSELKIDFKVGRGIGFVLDNDALHFGKVPKDGLGGASMSKRYFSVYNKNDKPIEINFTISESIRDWVTISENPVLIAPKENRQLKAELVLPQNHGLSEGKYNGTLYIVFVEVG